MGSTDKCKGLNIWLCFVEKAEWVWKREKGICFKTEEKPVEISENPLLISKVWLMS